MESSRRSSWVASLLASTTEVRMVNPATTVAAATEAARATRVRNELVRPRHGKVKRLNAFRRAMTSRASRLCSQHVADPAYRVNDPRHAVALELAPQVTDENIRDVRLD